MGRNVIQRDATDAIGVDCDLIAHAANIRMLMMILGVEVEGESIGPCRWYCDIGEIQVMN